jgi:hypothetical protein
MRARLHPPEGIPMTEHQLFLNLGDNDYVEARCSCGKWHREQMLEQEQEASEVYQILEREFQKHADEFATPPAPPAD